VVSWILVFFIVIPLLSEPSDEEMCAEAKETADAYVDSLYFELKLKPYYVFWYDGPFETSLADFDHTTTYVGCRVKDGDDIDLTYNVYATSKYGANSFEARIEVENCDSYVCGVDDVDFSITSF